MVIVGPSFDNVSHASHAPIATAIKGISQIADTRRDRRVGVDYDAGVSVGSRRAARVVCRDRVAGLAVQFRQAQADSGNSKQSVRRQLFVEVIEVFAI